jgi:DNA-binding response OmpR family regulator
MALGLSQHGYDTEPCENGVNALKKLESYIKNNIKLDGIVVDLRLPDIDGIKLVKIMKFKYPNVPIIMISGYATGTIWKRSGTCGSMRSCPNRSPLTSSPGSS